MDPFLVLCDGPMPSGRVKKELGLDGLFGAALGLFLASVRAVDFLKRRAGISFCLCPPGCRKVFARRSSRQ